ncbi:hypothetical protein JW758_01020 [Candidatus Peregrinibacteria bacterium]|nr:hypothetical protein [Candidatus Peregrinibacteria bacterium]
MKRIFEVGQLGTDGEPQKEQGLVDEDVLANLVIEGDEVDLMLAELNRECEEARVYIKQAISSHGYGFVFHTYYTKVMKECGNDIRKARRAVAFYYGLEEGRDSNENNEFQTWRLGADLRTDRQFGTERIYFDEKSATRDVINTIVSKVPFN